MIDIVIGLQYGDEGKGKVVNYLAECHKYDLCIRYNGGCNAGHTVYVDKTETSSVKIVTHLVPSGIIHGIPSIIGDNCYIDLEKLKKELEDLKSNKIELKNKLFISNKCHIITEKHKEEDGNDTIIGTTKSGIGPCATDKYNRCGIKIDEMLLKEYGLEMIELIDVSEYIMNLIKYKNNSSKFPNILIEGAQGFGLDINHGDYPYVTSSHCISTDCFNIGIPIFQLMKRKEIVTIYGIAKIYETYVGAKKFQGSGDVLDEFQKEGNEYGATTNRKRQCNYLNLNLLIDSCWINQVDKLIINKCDIIKKIGVYKLYYNDAMFTFKYFIKMRNFIIDKLCSHIFWLNGSNIMWSETPYGI